MLELTGFKDFILIVKSGQAAKDRKTWQRATGYSPNTSSCPAITLPNPFRKAETQHCHVVCGGIASCSQSQTGHYPHRDDVTGTVDDWEASVH